MTFTYSISSLTSTLAQVRLDIGDTVEQDYSLADEEIAVADSRTNSVISASILAMEWRMARLAEYIANSAAGQSKSLNQKYEQAEKQYKVLKSRLKKGKMGIHAGSIEQDRIDDAKDDTNYPQPSARVGQDDRDSDCDDPTTDCCS